MTPIEKRECIRWACRRLKRRKLRENILPGVLLGLIIAYMFFALTTFGLMLLMQHPLLTAAGIGMLASAYVFAWLLNRWIVCLLKPVQHYRLLV